MTPDEEATTERHVKMLLTSGVVTPCWYAERPGDRPSCARLGAVRYGPITLCRECDLRRSSVGKGMTRTRLADPDALLGVLAAREACRRAEEALRQAVDAARRAGQPWAALGAVLDTTRQGAQQRFGRPALRPVEPTPADERS